MMRHLYLRVYIAMVLILVVFTGLVSLTWWLWPGHSEERSRLFAGAGAIFDMILPPEHTNAQALDVLETLSSRIDVDLTLRNRQGGLIAATGEPLALPEDRITGWEHGFRKGPIASFALADGRWLIANPRHRPHPFRGIAFLWVLLLLAAAVAIGAHPLSRRITRRLERLQSRVEQLGAGDLSARVEIQGRDEVAELAKSFNRAAERIEQLVASQKSMLASASHELRSPLTRIRMGIELLAKKPTPNLHQRIAKDIAELDDLIDELLLASRLEATGLLGGQREPASACRRGRRQSGC